tara:strand:+ start:92 stop:775 length:684 start_codon:yes stop_codon:yes gene_type:complete
MDSALIWQGPSAFNGEPIKAVVTNIGRKSINRKTGDMAQLYILDANDTPLQGVKTANDASVCGECPYRPVNANGGPECYVNTFMLTALFNAKREFHTPLAVNAELRRLKRPLRLGAYGDPAMLPPNVLATLTNGVKTVTGYSHQWSWADTGHSDWLMASVGSVADKRQANAMGYRTYRVVPKGQDAKPDNGEIQCPEQSSGGKVQCADCGLCGGNNRPAKNIYINAI